MKPIMLLFILLPFNLPGQRFQIGWRTGYSNTSNIDIFQGKVKLGGLTNQVSAGYYCSRHFLLSASYETNRWQPYNNNSGDPVMGRNHSFGVMGDFIYRRFFAGINAQMTQFDPFHGTPFSYKYYAAFTYGLHAGLRQKLSRQLYLTGDAGCMWFPINGLQTAMLQVRYQQYPQEFTHGFLETFRVYYFRLGLSYDLGIRKDKKAGTPVH